MLQTLVAGLLLAAHPSAGPADTLVVCPTAMRGALGPWLEYRQAQGHRIQVIRPRRTAAALQDDIRRVARGEALRFLVLVGDVRAEGRGRDPAWLTPTSSVPARVNVLWGSTPRIASDHPYADLDGDGVPDLASGRLPADTPAELSRMIAKTIAYEQQAPGGPWRRRVHFVAGLGGFGPVSDKALEWAARSLITRAIPDGYRTTMTYASWRSAYCPNPLRFREMTLRRLNEGALFWVYIGHGHWSMLDSVHTAGVERPILTTADVRRLACPRGLPIAVFLCCYAGAFDAPEDCLAEEMVRQRGAPVAVVAGTRVTMPYGMAVLATELFGAYLSDGSEALGQLLLDAKRAMLVADRPGSQTKERAAIDLLARVISPAPDQLDVERREHVAMFHLLGDPLLRIKRPHAVSLDCPAQCAAGDRLRVVGRCDVEGRCTVELAAVTGQLPFRLPERSAPDGSAAQLQTLQATYERANRRRITHAVCLVEDGAFRAELRVPADARGHYVVRAFVEGKRATGVGAGRIRVLSRNAVPAGQ